MIMNQSILHNINSSLQNCLFCLTVFLKDVYSFPFDLKAFSLPKILPSFSILRYQFEMLYAKKADLLRDAFRQRCDLMLLLFFYGVPLMKFRVFFD